MAEASPGLLSRPSERATLLAAWAVSVSLPALGLVLLLATPAADVRWEHHPSHFWLVLAAALTSAALAFQTSGIALRRADARLFSVSLAFLSAAGFLALHALATPGVLLDGPNQGFVLATPFGLLLAALFAALSALRLPPERASAVIRHARALRIGLLVAMAAWAALSLASIPPLDDPTPTERATGGLLIPAAIALALFAYAGWRYLLMAVRSGSAILLAVASACFLLAEAMVAVALARNWQLTWWEWHVLMLVAFGAIAFSARREESAERFSDLYLDHTAAGKREVSLLFADLAGFTSFSERRDPRGLRDAQCLLRSRHPADCARVRGQDRPADRRCDHGHLGHPRRPARPRRAGGERGGGSASRNGPHRRRPPGLASLSRRGQQR